MERRILLILAVSMASSSAWADRILDSHFQQLRRGEPAGASELNNCEYLGKHLTDDPRYALQAPACFEFMLGQAEVTAIKQSDDGNTLVYGARNILFERKTAQPSGTTQTYVIAGPQTQLEKITSVSIDKKNKELVALESTANKVLFFKAEYPGNVTPMHYLNSTSLQGATSVAVEPVRDELFVANPINNEVTVFPRVVLVDNNRKNRSATPLRRLAGSNTQMVAPTAVATDGQDGQLFVADKGGNQILVFGIAQNGNVPPLNVIPGGQNGIDHPVAISYAANEDELQVINSDGSVARIPRPPAILVIPNPS